MPHSIWNLPGPGIEPRSPTLAGGFLLTVPAGEVLRIDSDLSARNAFLLELGLSSSLTLPVSPPLAIVIL